MWNIAKRIKLGLDKAGPSQSVPAGQVATVNPVERAERLRHGGRQRGILLSHGGPGCLRSDLFILEEDVVHQVA